MKQLISLVLISLIAMMPTLARQALPQVAEPSVPSVPPPASRLDVAKLKQLLDRDDVVGAIRLLERGWQEQYENYYQGQLTTKLLAAEAISQQLTNLFRFTGKRSALVYAVPTPSHLELILVLPGARPVHRRVPTANRKALLEVVKSFHDGVMDSASPRSAYLPLAQQLYRWMIAPLKPALTANRIDTLVFCLGGGLRTAPLAALHDGDRFLVEQYNLAIIPAFNLLDSRPVSLKGAKVLAMGASKFEAHSPLPFVPAELKAIVTNLWSGDMLLNQDFTIPNLKAYREKQLYRIVHLATHADFAPGAIQESYIQFWDQRLSPNRLRELRLSYPEVQLLVLSACRTAVGNPQAELGFAGLAVMSGSRAVIASLWYVSDAGTMILMKEFYQQLKTLNKAEALRQAQIAMLHKRTQVSNSMNNMTHPYYWAAFTVIGNPW